MAIFEYKYRLGSKDPELINQDIIKIQWFERAVKYLISKIENGKAIPGMGAGFHGLPSELIKEK